MFSKLFCLIGGLLVSTIAASSLRLTEEICYTQVGRSSIAHVPTVSQVASVYWLPILTATTLTPMTTLTPTSVSVTSTFVSIETFTSTASQVTDTFNTVTTLYSTSTISATVTSTSTTISTFTTSLTTTLFAPTSPGFIPIFSYISSIGDTPSKRDLLQQKPVKNIDHPLARRTAKTTPLSIAPTSTSKVSYPSKVICKELVAIIPVVTVTSTAKSTSTITAPAITSSFTSTSTLSTTTVIPTSDASMTIIISTTSTLVTTMTSTTATTVTSSTTTNLLSVATDYAASCQANNILHAVNGYTVYNTYLADGYSQGTAVDGADCCNQCQLLGASCAVWFFGGPPFDGQCFFLPQEDGSCSPTEDATHGFFTTTLGGVTGAAVGNSGCGQYHYIGDCSLFGQPGTT